MRGQWNGHRNALVTLNKWRKVTIETIYKQQRYKFVEVALFLRCLWKCLLLWYFSESGIPSKNRHIKKSYLNLSGTDEVKSRRIAFAFDAHSKVTNTANTIGTDGTSPKTNLFFVRQKVFCTRQKSHNWKIKPLFPKLQYWSSQRKGTVKSTDMVDALTNGNSSSNAMIKLRVQ